MLTTDGRTLCATTTIGVRRAAETVGEIGAPPGCGWRLSTVCDSAIGLQARSMMMRSRATRFMIALSGCQVVDNLTTRQPDNSTLHLALRESKTHLQPRGRPRTGETSRA